MLEKEHLVPLRARSWDEYGVEVKEATAPAATIKAFGDMWVAAESTVRDLRQNGRVVSATARAYEARNRQRALQLAELVEVAVPY